MTFVGTISNCAEGEHEKDIFIGYRCFDDCLAT